MFPVAPEDYFYQAVLWAVQNGILKCTADGPLNLGVNVTRGQSAALAGRALKVIS